MKTLTNKNIILGFCLVVSSGLFLFFTGDTPLFNHLPKITPQITQLIGTAKQSPNQEILEDLERQEAGIKALIKKHGFNEEGYKQYEASFYAQNKPQRHPGISQETCNLIYEVLNDFHVPRESIGIQPYSGRVSPAAAELKTIFVDEAKLKQYPRKAQKFVIGHELQHIIHNDDCLGMYAGKTLGFSENYDHPVNQMRRFMEHRADMKAITKHADYAQGHIEFFESYLKTHGDGEKSKHPEPSARLKVAQQVYQNFKTVGLA